MLEAADASSDHGAAAGWIEQDLECYGCGYNLRTLRRDGVCTECGLPVSDSYSPVDFIVSSRHDVARMTRGLAIFIFAILLRALFVPVVVVGHRFWPNLGLWTMWATSDAWIVLDTAVRGLELAAGAALLYPAQSKSGSVDWVGRLMLTALGISFLASGWHALTSFTVSLGISNLQLAVIVELEYVGIGLFWLFLLLRARRKRARSARLAADVAILLSVLAIIVNVYAMGYFGMIPVGWVSGWDRAADGAFWFVLLLAAWVYVRRLRIAPPVVPVE